MQLYETSKLSHIVAYSYGENEETIKKLLVECADEVKRINGATTYEEDYFHLK